MLVAGFASGFPDMAMQRKVLEPRTEITGAQTGMSPLDKLAPMKPAGAGYITLVRPASLSIQGNYLFLLDAGLRRVFRYDRGQQTLAPFTRTSRSEAGISIHAAPGTSVYVTDPAREQVLHFTWDGTPLPPLISHGKLARPVPVTVDASNGQVLVADGLNDQIVILDGLGKAIGIIKPQHVLNIAAMVSGPDGLCVVDRLAKQVVVLGRDGRFLYAFGADPTSEPCSIAVSHDNLVLVSDNFEHVIKVCRVQRTGNITGVLADVSGQSGRMASSSARRPIEVGEDALTVVRIGSIGVAPGSFNGIAGLSVADDFLSLQTA